MELTRRAAAWRREFLTIRMIDGWIVLAGGALCGAAAAAWSDRLFALPQGFRWAVLVAGNATLWWGVWRRLVRPWISLDWPTVLDAAARRYPQMKDHLLSAWELQAGDASLFTSDELRLAHLARTEELLRDLPEERLLPRTFSPAAKRAALSGLLAACSLPWLAASPAWERVLAPWRDVPLERYLDVTPGDAHTPWGEDVALLAKWKPGTPPGRDRRELVLRVEGPDGWKAARWDAINDNEARFTAEGLSASLRYRLQWRDLESKVYRVTPVSLPELESLQARVHGAESAVSALTAAEPLSVLRGTMITISGRPNQALSGAWMRLSTVPSPVAMKPGPNGDYEASLVVSEDATVRFELETPDGRRNPGNVSYALKAQPDLPPKIELVSPLEPLAASPQDMIPIAYSATDDGGLTRISLLVRAKGMPQKELVLERLSSKREFSGEHAWDLSALPLGKAEFQLKAVDNATPPQTGLSAIGAVDIADFAAGHADAQARWSKAEDSLKNLVKKEAEEMARAAQAQGTMSQKEAEEYRKAWVESAKDFRDWQQSMEKDAYANPGLSEAAKTQASSLEQAAKNDVPEALRAANAGDKAAAQRKHAQLATRAQQALRLLSEGRKIQGLQDFYSEAGRMSQAGADMQSQLDSLAQKGAADPEAVKRLKQGLDKLQKQMEALAKTMASLPTVDPNSAEARSRRTYEMPLEAARQQADALSQALAKGDFARAAEIAKQLSESLEQMQRSLGQAASDAAAAGQSRQASEKMQKAQALWSQAVEEQTKVLEQTRALQQKRVEQKLAAQKDLLAELARRQEVLDSSAAAQGAAFPMDALNMMKAVQSELENKKVDRSVSWLKGAAARLRMERPRWDEFVEAEDAIRDKLENGAPMPPEQPSAESRSAGQSQSQARGKTRELQKQLEAIDAETGGLPREVMEKIMGAQGEQSAAEDSLNKGQAEGASGHEESALNMLNAGGQSLNQAMSGAQGEQMGLTQPFSRPTGAFRMMPGGEGGGSRLGFVPLPGAKEYAPPKELREELKKSLQESRPASYDPIIKEYFKRISQ